VALVTEPKASAWGHKAFFFTYDSHLTPQYKIAALRWRSESVFLTTCAVLECLIRGGPCSKDANTPTTERLETFTT
jgi:hypothetical protein